LRPAKIKGEEIRNRLVWAGGYGEEIDYTKSSLFDIYFFDLFYRTHMNGGGEVERVERTLEKLERTMPGLASSLSLRVVARTGRNRYRDLIKGEAISD